MAIEIDQTKQAKHMRKHMRGMRAQARKLCSLIADGHRGQRITTQAKTVLLHAKWARSFYVGLDTAA